jgi:hypothetical protein
MAGRQVCFFLGTAIRQHEIHAAGGELLCDDLPNALPAGDDLDLAVQIHEVHPIAAGSECWKALQRRDLAEHFD